MIARRSRAAYVPAMVVRHLVRVLTMLALLFAPLSMMSGHAAMAMPVAADAASHHKEAGSSSADCGEMGSESQDDDVGSTLGDCLTDCAVACSAIPALGSAMADQPLPPAMDQPLPLLGRVRSLHPESTDPPPRIA